MNKKLTLPIIVLSLLGIATVFLYAGIEPESYIVVIDPGHGGRNITPFSSYGDKFNPLTGKYGDTFKDGAYHKGLYESEEVYDIASRVQGLLKLTHTEAGRKKFYKILKKYSKNPPYPNQPIKVFLSRKANYIEHYKTIKHDINAPYRLYDYPDIKTGELKDGRITRINKLHPHLVLSIHLNAGYNPKHGRMGSVITPSYYTFKKAIDYVRSSTAGRKKIKKRFEKGSYNNWMPSCRMGSHFESFLCDSWIYFTGFWSNKSGTGANTRVFRGYRYNMVSWNYKDGDRWITKAARHLKNTSYSIDLRHFKAKGPFWEREKSKYEFYRREKGLEGYGGDNLYAGNEVLRYVRKALLVNHVDSRKTLPELDRPYLSTWSVPTYINAISAYLELGYLTSTRDHKRVRTKKWVYTEGIAVGIYSILYSMPQPKGNHKIQMPVGKKLNLAKYGDHFLDAH